MSIYCLLFPFQGAPSQNSKEARKKAKRLGQQPPKREREGNWDLLQMEQRLLKLAAEQSRGVLYFLAVPMNDGRWVLR